MEIIEKPISFNTAMVQDIMNNRKTQDRRVVNRLRGFGNIRTINESDNVGFWRIQSKNKGWDIVSTEKILSVLPYQVGDVLWVQETWAHCHPILDVKRPDGRAITEISDGYAEYKVDGFETIQELKDHRRLVSGHEIVVNGDKWRPSTNMPRWAARIFLEVTDVRLERLQDISESDAINEGVLTLPLPQEYQEMVNDAKQMGIKPPLGYTPKELFALLWDSVNSKSAPWESNPVVAVYEFKKIENKVE